MSRGSLTVKINMAPRSGMTPAACAIVKGMLESGLNAFLIVMSEDAKRRVRHYLPEKNIIVINGASYLFTSRIADAFVVDNAQECGDIWRLKCEGELVPCIESCFATRGTDITRIFLFYSTLPAGYRK